MPSRRAGCPLNGGGPLPLVAVSTSRRQQCSSTAQGVPGGRGEALPHDTRGEGRGDRRDSGLGDRPSTPVCEADTDGPRPWFRELRAKALTAASIKRVCVSGVRTCGQVSHPLEQVQSRPLRQKGPPPLSAAFGFWVWRVRVTSKMPSGFSGGFIIGSQAWCLGSTSWRWRPARSFSSPCLPLGLSALSENTKLPAWFNPCQEPGPEGNGHAVAW